MRVAVLEEQYGNSNNSDSSKMIPVEFDLLLGLGRLAERSFLCQLGKKLVLIKGFQSWRRVQWRDGPETQRVSECESRVRSLQVGTFAVASTM